MAQFNSQAQRYLSNNDVLFEQVMLAGLDGKPSGLSNGTSFDAFSRFRTSEPFTLFDSSHRYSDNGQFDTFTSDTNVNATHNASQGLIDMNVGQLDGQKVYRESNRVFPYQPGKSLLILSTCVFNTPKTNLRQRMGYFGAENGVYLENDGATTYFVKRSLVTGSVEEIKVAQENWNVDKLDGNGISGFDLDISKAQILWIDLEWLGAGTVRMGFVINGKFVHCHSFHHANLITSTYFTTASLPVRYEIENTGATASDSTLKQICSTVISEGGYQLSGTTRSVHVPISTPRDLTDADAYYPIISIRLKSARKDAVVIPSGLSAIGVSNSGANYHWELREGGEIIEPALPPSPSWTSAAEDSAVEYKLNGVGMSQTEPYKIVANGYFSVSNQSVTSVDVLKEAVLKFQLKRNSFTSSTIPLTLVVASDGDANQVYASMNWEEVVH